MTVCDAHPGAETWRPVPGARYYEVSSRGGFRSVDRTLNDGRSRQGQPIATRPSNKGYLLVNYTGDEGKRVTRTVHSTVLEAFAGPRPDGKESCHANGVRTDNCWPENLRWGTKPENEADKPPQARGGNFPCVNHAQCGGRTVSEGRRCRACVQEIGKAAAEMLRAGLSLAAVTRRLGYGNQEWVYRLASEFGAYMPPIRQARRQRPTLRQRVTVALRDRKQGGWQ